MTDGCREIRRTLGEARWFLANAAHARPTCGFIGLARVSRGSELASEGPETQNCRHWDFHLACPSYLGHREAIW